MSHESLHRPSICPVGDTRPRRGLAYVVDGVGSMAMESVMAHIFVPEQPHAKPR